MSLLSNLPASGTHLNTFNADKLRVRHTHTHTANHRNAMHTARVHRFCTTHRSDGDVSSPLTIHAARRSSLTTISVRSCGCAWPCGIDMDVFACVQRPMRQYVCVSSAAPAACPSSAPCAVNMLVRTLMAQKLEAEQQSQQQQAKKVAATAAAAQPWSQANVRRQAITVSVQPAQTELQQRGSAAAQSHGAAAAATAAEAQPAAAAAATAAAARASAPSPTSMAIGLLRKNRPLHRPLSRSASPSPAAMGQNAAAAAAASTSADPSASLAAALALSAAASSGPAVRAGLQSRPLLMTNVVSKRKRKEPETAGAAAAAAGGSAAAAAALPAPVAVRSGAALALAPAASSAAGAAGSGADDEVTGLESPPRAKRARRDVSSAPSPSMALRPIDDDNSQHVHSSPPPLHARDAATSRRAGSAAKAAVTPPRTRGQLLVPPSPTPSTSSHSSHHSRPLSSNSVHRSLAHSLDVHQQPPRPSFGLHSTAQVHVPVNSAHALTPGDMLAANIRHITQQRLQQLHPNLPTARPPMHNAAAAGAGVYGGDAPIAPVRQSRGHDYIKRANAIEQARREEKRLRLAREEEAALASAAMADAAAAAAAAAAPSAAAAAAAGASSSSAVSPLMTPPRPSFVLQPQQSHVPSKRKRPGVVSAGRRTPTHDDIVASAAADAYRHAPAVRAQSDAVGHSAADAAVAPQRASTPPANH